MRTFNLREPLNNFALLAPDQNLLLQEKKDDAESKIRK